MDRTVQRKCASKLSQWSISQGIRHRTVLADELGVPRRRINAWFRNTVPSKPYLHRLAEVTGDAEFLTFRPSQEEACSSASTS